MLMDTSPSMTERRVRERFILYETSVYSSVVLYFGQSTHRPSSRQNHHTGVLVSILRITESQKHDPHGLHIYNVRCVSTPTVLSFQYTTGILPVVRHASLFTHRDALPQTATSDTICSWDVPEISGARSRKKYQFTTL